MGNQLFQQARDFVEKAKISRDSSAIEVARNALSSAYANSTTAEKVQLREMQKIIDTL